MISHARKEAVMNKIHNYDHSLFMLLIREVTELNAHIKRGYAPSGRHAGINIQRIIHEVLCECLINIASHGYTFIKDGIMLIRDREGLEVCLSKDIYPRIAEKHNHKGVSKIEHSIRNAINAAYAKSICAGPDEYTLMRCFRCRPSSKEFLLFAAHEVNCRIAKDICV